MAAAKKRKRLDLDDGDAGLAGRLAAHGERFLSMFDDAADRAVPPNTAPTVHSGNSESDPEDKGSSSSGGGSGSCSDNSSSDDEEGAAAGDDLLDRLFASGGRSQARGSSGHHRRAAVGSGAARRASAARGGGPAGGAGGVPAAPLEQQQFEELVRLKAERKRFMSSKAAVVTGKGSSSQQEPAKRSRPGRHAAAPGGVGAGGVAGSAGNGVTRAEFQEMQREVQTYGASALDRKAKKKFEAEQLERMGAKAAARPRVPASIAIGMAKKQAQRDDRALQEGIAAGMIQAKGLGKKKRREKSRQLDKGLNEDGGAFRSGVLRVKAPPPQRKSSGGGGKRRK
ncbi:hypothetical protein D9Q98_005601 [Chlorella vulgaris]|uniref:Uncharacterized protein n=1 Tax=Chlorella vulgaris TaxID=3077 RepID=A0A9D4TMJ1_CHLVU|nr:hypothetical protein D9Q98_005601 [Chlorella vulgaris]